MVYLRSAAPLLQVACHRQVVPQAPGQRLAPRRLLKQVTYACPPGSTARMVHSVAHLSISAPRTVSSNWLEVAAALLVRVELLRPEARRPLEVLEPYPVDRMQQEEQHPPEVVKVLDVPATSS